jgi:DNA-binding LytR/AlgR family response regulator
MIVDDEPLASQLIASYVQDIPDIHCVGIYTTALDAFAALHTEMVDVIFLDIEMPGINGLSFIRSLKYSPRVIFITAYSEYAVAAFEVEALDYLVKPVTFERFLKAVQKLGIHSHKSFQQPSSDLTHIFLKIDRRLVKIVLSEIRYIEGSGDYLKVHVTGHTYTSYMTMAKMETMLPALSFLRIHRSVIVNTSFIEFIEGNYVKLGDVELTIGQTYKEAVLKKLG